MHQYCLESGPMAGPQSLVRMRTELAPVPGKSDMWWDNATRLGERMWNNHLPFMAVKDNSGQVGAADKREYVLTSKNTTPDWNR